jgi:hypothetical protein
MLKEWEAKDPILRYEKYLTAKKLWTEKEKNDILARIDRELKEGQAEAEASPLPPAERAAEGVYCDGCHEIRAEWKRSPKPGKPGQKSSAQWFEGTTPALAPLGGTGVASTQARTLVPAGNNPGHRKKRQTTQTKHKRQRR